MVTSNNRFASASVSGGIVRVVTFTAKDLLTYLAGLETDEDDVHDPTFLLRYTAYEWVQHELFGGSINTDDADTVFWDATVSVDARTTRHLLMFPLTFPGHGAWLFVVSDVDPKRYPNTYDDAADIFPVHVMSS